MRLLEEALLPRPQSSQRNIFVPRGLGGIGKTQLAIQFVRMNYFRYSAVFWLDGSSKDRLEHSILSCASRLPPDQITEASRAYHRGEKGDIDGIVREVLCWFEQSDNQRWLIIFDNVDQEFNPTNSDPLAYDIKLYLPNADHGSIMITTRLAQLEHLGDSQVVGKVNSLTAQEILKVWYKKPDGSAKPASACHDL